MSLSDELLLIRMQLLGARQVASESQLAAAGLLEVGAAEATVGREAEFAAEKQFLFGQSLYSLRRYLFYGTTAAGAFAYGIGKLGLAFDDARDGGVSTFTAILGSQRAASAEMNRLIALTHDTGFQLTELEQGEQQLLTFGLGAKTSTMYLEDLAIAAQKLHQGTSGLQTFLDVFARIQDQGQLTGRTLLQLTRLGVPALQILQKKLHLSPLQVSELQRGQLVIPAQYALPALASGMRNLPGSFDLGAQFGKFRGYAGELAGVLLQPLFDRLSRKGGFLDRLDGRLAAATAGYKKGGTTGLLDGLDPSGTLATGWGIFRNVLKATSNVLHVTYAAAKPFLPLLSALATILASVAGHGDLVKLMLYGLAIRYAYTRTASLAFWAANKLVGGGLYDLLGVTAKSSAYLKLLGLRMYSSEIRQLALTRAVNAGKVAMIPFQKGLALGRASLSLLTLSAGRAVIGLRALAIMLGILDAELALTPIGWIAIGVVALATLAILIWKVTAVRNAFTWVGKEIGGLFTGAFHAVNSGAHALFGLLKGVLQFVYNSIAAIANALINLGTFGLGGLLAGHGYGGSVIPYWGNGAIPGLAGGGDVTRGGSVFVGERGPELLHLPAGARVTPLKSSAAGGGGLVEAFMRALERMQITPSDVDVDGRKIAEITFAWGKRLEALQ